MPVQVLQALVALALLYDRTDFAAALLIGFMALLRPGELVDPRVADVLLPHIVLCRPGTFYVVIRSPKMRRLAARREHVLVAEPSVTAFLETALRGRAPKERVFPGGGADLRRVLAGLLLAFRYPDRGYGWPDARLTQGGWGHLAVLGNQGPGVSPMARQVGGSPDP